MYILLLEIYLVIVIVAVPIIPFSSFDWHVTISLHSWVCFLGVRGDIENLTSAILPCGVFLKV